MSAVGYDRKSRPCRRYVRLTPSSRRSRDLGRTSADDPQETFALLEEVELWSLTTVREKLIKIGAKVVLHGRYVTFQLAEVAIPKSLFAEILRLIDRLRPAPLLP